MNNHQHVPAKIHNFSLAFQQMCSMVAIGQTKSQDETLRELVLQTLVLLPEEKISNERDLTKIFNTLFGLQIADHEIKFAIERLISEEVIVPSGTGSLLLSEPIAKAVRVNIDTATALEGRVRDGWSEELNTNYPELSFTDSWLALRNYLAGAFLRHGIQAVALLDSSFEMDHIHSQSLTELLNSAVKDIPSELRLNTKRAISNFVAATGHYPERSKYIAQLADGAFNYFSLATDPKVAEKIRQNLNPITLFLDTNFLFGILGLTINPQVAVSEELIRAIHQYKFPFSLKRHKKTQDELLSTVTKYEGDLSQRHWSKNISRAAITSRFLSGVEVKYHQAYIETGIDVQSFFRPYHHADVLLNERAIDSYDEKNIDDQSQQRIATLIADYEDFLKAKGRDKPYKTIDHDMTVLDVARQLRGNAKSTLEAGALVLTCDYSLYAFDWEISKKQGVEPCTVLPNLLWQVLRPLIPSDENFSQAFAQTFAIPEFRTISSGSAAACSKMISIMAGYKDFPEETAARMLSNDILIDQLRKAQSDEEFQSFVDAAIVNENAQLIGENTMLVKKYEVEKIEKNEISRQLADTTAMARQQEEYIFTEKERRVQAEKNATQEREERQKAEKQAKDEKDKRTQAEEKLSLTFAIVKAVLFGVLAISLFELLVYKLPWSWLKTHPNSYGLQGSFGILLLALGFALFISKWRKYIWIPIVLPIGLIVLQLLGGPN
ncbi:MAG: hypothetical protein Q8L64_01605 [bacterium]|nr:hypothetical protein [bacterium]